jgi:hypothetical protein
MLVSHHPFVFPRSFLVAMLAVAATITLPVSASKAADYEWVKVTMNAEFAARDGAGALSYKGRMWLLGGWNPIAADRAFFPRICNNEVWSTVDGKSWTLVKPNSFVDQTFDAAADWEGRHTAGYAVFRDRMWIIGGDVNQGHYQNDVWSSTNGSDWTLVNAGQTPPWAPRALHYTVVHDHKIWVIGGQTMPGFAKDEAGEVFYRDIWTTQDGINWTEVKPQEPVWSARGMIGGSAVLNGRIWVIGGGTYDTPTTPSRKFHNDVWSSADGVQWTEHTAAAPWKPRQYHEVAAWDNRLWVLEGYNADGGNRNDVWYSDNGVDWQEVPATPWKPRHAASVFVHNDALWMVAGNNMQPDVWKLVRTKKAEKQ